MPLTIPNSLRLAAALIFTAAAAPVLAQKYTPEPPPLLAPPCQPTKKKPCPPPTTDTPAAPAPASTTAFPFPGESQQDEGKPAPSTTTTPESAPPSSFPFPGEPAAPEAPASSSSSSSDAAPAPDPDQPALKDEGTTGSTRFSRKRLPKVNAVAPEDREAEDLEVSRYYFSTGAFQAAYLRAKDAVTTLPDDPEAHLALAQSAQRLGKPEEAAAEYNALLKLDCSDKQKKAAQKALSELAGNQPKLK